MSNRIDVEPTWTATGSLTGDYFDRVYAGSADPWDFERSPYEAAKYAATVAVLPRPQYSRGLELGCSIGVLTRQLVPRCDRLVAVDVSEAALTQARARCADLAGVLFERCDIASEFPPGPFDLIVMSEVGYYFSRPDLERLRSRMSDSLTARGHLLLVHYTGETNYPLTADAVHEFFLESDDGTWTRLAEARGAYRLDLLEKPA